MTPHFVTIIDEQGRMAAVIPFDESDHQFNCLEGKPLGSTAMTDAHKQELMVAYAEALIDSKRAVCHYRSRVDKGKAFLEIQVMRFPEVKASALTLSRVVPQTPNVKLTTREFEILKLSAKDKCDEQIASALKIARGTVSRHKQNIRTKIGVKEWSSAVLWAATNDLL